MKDNKVKLLLAILSDGNWHWGDELAQKLGWRFSDPIYRARKTGYKIEKAQDGKRHRYRLATISVACK